MPVLHFGLENQLRSEKRSIPAQKGCFPYHIRVGSKRTNRSPAQLRVLSNGQSATGFKTAVLNPD